MVSECGFRNSPHGLARIGFLVQTSLEQSPSHRQKRPGPLRVAALDLARGLAVCAMILYHLAWDLESFGLATLGILTDPAWLAARTVILSAFLLIAGISLPLAARRGKGGIQTAQVMKVALPAIAISLVSYLFIPQQWIFFGVLHFLTLALVLSQFLLMVRPRIIFCLAAIPLALEGFDVGFERMDALWLQWIGLSKTLLPTVDYVPLVPWLGVFWVGLGLGQILRWAMVYHPLGIAFASWKPQTRLFRPLLWMGRKALWIYLGHQPVLIGILFGYYYLWK